MVGWNHPYLLHKGAHGDEHLQNAHVGVLFWSRRQSLKNILFDMQLNKIVDFESIDSLI